MAGANAMNPWLYWGRIALYAAVAAGAVVTVLPELDTNAWYIRLLDFPRMQFLISLALLLVLLLALPGRFRVGSLVASLAALVAMTWQAVMLFPYSSLERPEMLAAAPSCPEANQLRIAAVNVQMTNENAERLFAMLQEADPHLILLQETDAWWDERLQALEDRWEYSAEHITQNYFGMHILSRYPLVGPEVHFLTNSRNPSIFTGVALPAGQVIRFYGVHPRPPLPGQSSAERDGQLLAAALAIRQDAMPSVMAGDFNAVPWEDVMQQTERVAGLLAPRIGRGWVPTYRTNSLVVTWPLDHVLAGPQFTLRGLETLPDFGSDHYPIVAAFCFAPEAASMQAAPQVAPGDIAAARLAVSTAQDEAARSPEPAEGSQTPQPGRS
ncbi:MAG TPA: endonuclease/exonuclease/phosphatase family protein [Falsiroseomonas sp.]|nr:endonuclease/exonuclease/phosphatase family protein [Falsiroseomonas sp.]